MVLTGPYRMDKALNWSKLEHSVSKVTPASTVNVVSVNFFALYLYVPLDILLTAGDIRPCRCAPLAARPRRATERGRRSVGRFSRSPYEPPSGPLGPDHPT